MNPVKEIKTTWQSIPSEVQQFLKRALIIFIIWKMIYHLFLFNGRVIDKPLTDWSTKGAEKIMQVFYPKSVLSITENCSSVSDVNNEIVCYDFLIKDGKKIVGVADGCNALELYILYLGFLIAFPAVIKRVLLFSMYGIATIYIANITRLAALASMNMHRMNAVDMAHHYVFKLIVYSLIFGFWILFAKQNKQHDEV
jgi:exosortase family protein XrtF